MTHSPGPWRKGTDTTSYGQQAVVADCPPGCKCDKDSIEAYGGHVICESVLGQNRDLIAAAPDLLEALKIVEGWLSSFSMPPASTIAEKQEHMAILQAAIAKAEGK